MPVELFGFSLGRAKKKLTDEAIIKNDGTLVNPSFVPPETDDGSTLVSGGGGGYFGQYLDQEGQIKSDNDLISRYRGMSLHSEIEMAVEDIVNEAIVYEHDYPSVKILLENVDQSASIKKKIEEEFDNCLRLLNFTNKGYEIFRRWFVDGRIFFHMITPKDQAKKGVVELRPIDALKIKKVKKIHKEKDQATQVEIVTKVEELYRQKLHQPIRCRYGKTYFWW